MDINSDRIISCCCIAFSKGMSQGIFMIFSLGLNLLHISMLVHLCKKYKHKLEPVHIFEINTLVDDCLMLSNVALRHLMREQLGHESLICKISTIITFASRLSFYLDICWTQLDRFLALYWNIGYKERVTNNKALFIITIERQFIQFVSSSSAACLFSAKKVSCVLDLWL